IEDATLNAAEVPLATVRGAVETLEQLLVVAEHGNINAASDAASGAHMARAAMEAAALNVLINVDGLANQSEADRLRAAVNELRERGRERVEAVLAAVEARTGLR